MNYIVALVSTIVNVVLAYTTLDRDLIIKIKVLGVNKEYQDEIKDISKLNKIIIMVFCAILTYICSIKILRDVSELINVIKMFVGLFCLTGSACVDYREKRIPNFFPIVLSLSGIILLILGVLTRQPDAVAYIYSSVFCTVACTLLLVLASLLTKQGIGAGDIKLIAALALACGVYTVCGTIFYGILVCSVVSIVCLITKRKTLQGSLPFGPFIVLGYVVSILNSMY